MRLDEQTFKLTDSGRIGRAAFVAGGIGLMASAVGYFADSAQFFHSWLTAFVFWITIGLGALAFTLIHHLTAAKWSVVLRRLSENIMVVLPVMGILFIPILFGMHDLYHWTHAEAVKTDQLLQGKSAYLNTTFFVIRLVAYFLIWFLVTRLLYKVSLAQDKGHDVSQIRRMRLISAPGIILFAITLTFASIDWMMSLDPHWYSTIYGVYVFSGSFVSLLAFMTLVVLYLRSRGILQKAITGEHYHDLGKLMFAFIVFWGYMAFSQYFLIWYANIPEETIWFLHRWEGSWKTVSLLLVFGHFVVPFFVLFPQGAKRNVIVMTVMAIWILVMHWVDMYWLIMPSLHPEGVHLSWMDFSTMLGIGGVFVWLFWKKTVGSAMLPVGDPALKDSMNFVNR